MSEIKKNKEINNSNCYSWVYSLQFFPDLIKRIKVILLIHSANKNKIIKLIQNQRINAASKIIRAYKNFKFINQLKQEYFIRKIISDRKKAIIKIVNNLKYYLNKLKLKKALRIEKSSYTIFCTKPNVAKISIKIFTDYNNIDNHKTILMNYCPITKYFICPIPKTKFVLAHKDSKIVRFHFIHDGNIFYQEEHYKLVDFKGQKVHEINFSMYDNVINTNNIYKKYNSNVDEDLKGLSYKSSSRQKSTLFNNELVLDFSSDEDENKCSRKTSKDSNGQKKQKFIRGKRKGKTCKLKNTNSIKIISILKERNCERRKRRHSVCERHVQFGTVEFSY